MKHFKTDKKSPSLFDTTGFKMTPMMEQFTAIKKEYPSEIIAFRLGDFYEMFLEDAKIASEILQINLTERHGVAMCGIPHHASQNYFYKLIQAGKKIAIAEQVEKPGEGKKILKRSVTQVITPGTVLDENNLDIQDNNFLVVLFFINRQKENLAIFDVQRKDFDDLKDSTSSHLSLLACACDVSTGEIHLLEENQEKDFTAVYNFLAIFRPKEILYLQEQDWINDFFPDKEYLLSSFKVANLPFHSAEKLIKEYYPFHPLDDLGLNKDSNYIYPIVCLFTYFKQTFMNNLKHLKLPIFINQSNQMYLDQATVTNLELIKNNYNSQVNHTLREAIDYTLTGMGGRKLQNWILHPLVHLEAIKIRQDKTIFFYQNPSIAKETRERLRKIIDFERFTAKLSLGKINPRDLSAFVKAIDRSIDLLFYLNKNSDKNASRQDSMGQEKLSKNSLSYLFLEASPIKIWLKTVKENLVSEPPILMKDGGYIKPESDSELFNYYRLKNKANDLVLQLLEKEKKKSRINNLKVKFTDNSGYFFEVSKAQSEAVPEYFIKKQTLVNVGRFITEELLQLQEEILSAKEKLVALEYQLYLKLIAEGKKCLFFIGKICDFIAKVDVYQSFSHLIEIENYHLPSLTEDGRIEIVAGRHPVVEKIEKEQFIENDLKIDNSKDSIHILTGPNMAGKSTYLRQNALIVLLAHLGAPVPARSAKIGLVDRIFTRIGATDNLSKGESTFLVEMNETANILKKVTSRSLVIMDEIGRGTSTYDGMSLAWSIICFLNRAEIKCKTLFATHYREITELAVQESITNYTVQIEEKDGKLIFLNKVTAGVASQSYGIHVAQMAGIPESIIQNAKEKLLELESGGKKSKVSSEVKEQKISSSDYLVLDKINVCEPMDMTPLEAISFLQEIKNTISKKK